MHRTLPRQLSVPWSTEPVVACLPPAALAGTIARRLERFRDWRLVQYALAVATPGLALWLALTFQPVLGNQVFGLFISAVMIAAWNGGLGPGLLAALMGVAAMDYFFEVPSYSLGIENPATGVQVITYLFAAVLISSLSNSLRLARGRAEEANRLREQAVQSVTHDLKTPLTVICAFAKLSRRHVERLDHPRADRIAQNLTTIETTGMRMSALLDELLDSGRLEAGHALELNHSPVDLLALCESKAAEAMVIEPSRPIRVIARDRNLIGCWDPRRLERVVDNLITNALKYGDPGSEICLELGREERPGTDCAVLQVRDCGPGIPPDELPRLFERFYRRPGTARWASGAGLGLAGVRTIVELHGGSIVVDSHLGEGSIFTVRLPL
jgi:signal transduction histidine kinase